MNISKTKGLLALLSTLLLLGFQGLSAETEEALDEAIPMDVTLEYTQAKEGETTLAKLAEGKKAVLLDFWATYCPPCKQYLKNELNKRAKQLEDQGIQVVTMNIDNKVKADDFRKTVEGANFPWLFVPEPNSPKTNYNHLLDISSVPRMVLLSPDGKVLFNGHPNDSKSLDKALSALL